VSCIAYSNEIETSYFDYLDSSCFKKSKIGVLMKSGNSNVEKHLDSLSKANKTDIEIEKKKLSFALFIALANDCKLNGRYFKNDDNTTSIRIHEDTVEVESFNLSAGHNSISKLSPSGDNIIIQKSDWLVICMKSMESEAEILGKFTDSLDAIKYAKAKWYSDEYYSVAVGNFCSKFISMYSCREIIYRSKK